MKPGSRAKRTNQAQVPSVVTGAAARRCPVCDAGPGHSCTKIVGGAPVRRVSYHPERKQG
jgi:hypothetical protein